MLQYLVPIALISALAAGATVNIPTPEKWRQKRRHGAFAATGTTILGLSLAMTSLTAVSADAAAPSFCEAGRSPYGLTSAQRNECGDSATPLARVQPIPGGGTTYVYEDKAEGSTTTFRVPPSTFNALTATSEELERYGVPARPMPDSPAYPQWVSMAEHMRFEAPPAEIITVPHRAAEDSSSNWSGYDNYASSQVYKEAAAWFTEPEIKETSCSEPAAYTWVGLGGVNSEQLAQTGTSVGKDGLEENEFWWEILPEYQHTLPMPIFYEEGGHPGAGKRAYAEVKAHSNYEFSFYVYAEGVSHSFTTTVSKNGYDGSTAEYIVERVGSDPLKNFGEVHFEPFTNEKGIESYGHHSIEMVNGSHVLASPGGISSDQFTDYHYNCL